MGILAAVRLAPAALPGPTLNDDWVQATSHHFVVFSNGGPTAATEVARRLERLGEVLARTNPGLIAATPKPTHVYAFRGEGSFKYYRSKSFENAAGYSMTDSDRDVIAYRANPEGSEESEVLYHEFIHGYLRNNLASLPLWLNEGLACYYSTFRPGDASAEIGHPLGFLRITAETNISKRMDI